MTTFIYQPPNNRYSNNSRTQPMFKVLSDGTIKFDAGVLYGRLPKSHWEYEVTVDRINRITLGLNSLFVRMYDKNILIDTGVGSKRYDDSERYDLVPSRLQKSQLQKNLRRLGVGPRDIDIVILTHLHFDHAGGCTMINREEHVIPTFPRAQYLVQSSCWDDACNPSELYEDMYHPDDFLPIKKRRQLELLDGDTEITPYLKVKLTNGHVRGHQIVFIDCGGERIVFPGDLIPTPDHLKPTVISSDDQFPEETLEQKRELLKKGEKEGLLFIFSHGSDHLGHAGYFGERRTYPYTNGRMRDGVPFRSVQL